MSCDYGSGSYYLSKDNMDYLEGGAEKHKQANGLRRYNKSNFLDDLLTSIRQKQKPKQKGTGKKFTDDDLKLAEWMEGRVHMIAPSTKKANLETWANTIRLMREVDKRTLQEIGGLFDWANKDSFWCANILSPEKLRKQWDKLNAKRINHDSTRQTNANQTRRLSATEQANQRLLEQYGNPSSRDEWPSTSIASGGMDQYQVHGGIPEQVGQSGITIDMEAGDFDSND